MSNYKYEGETFKLDDSKGCYVEVTYEGLTGYFGVNISGSGTDENPYSYHVAGEEFVTPDGMTKGAPSPSPENARDQICGKLLNIFRTQKAGETFDPAKYCKELHDAVKNQP